MTLEETIAHHRWCADICEGEVRDEQLQIVAWLEELVRLKAENAKLRELVRIMHSELVSCEDNGYVCGGHKFDKRVSELGVGVK